MSRSLDQTIIFALGGCSTTTHVYTVTQNAATHRRVGLETAATYYSHRACIVRVAKPGLAALHASQCDLSGERSRLRHDRAGRESPRTRHAATPSVPPLAQAGATARSWIDPGIDGRERKIRTSHLLCTVTVESAEEAVGRTVGPGASPVLPGSIGGGPGRPARRDPPGRCLLSCLARVCAARLCLRLRGALDCSAGHQ